MVGCFSTSMLHTSARVPDPGKGSPGRYVVRASQYTFTTDFEIQADDPLIVEMERLRDSMVETLGIIPQTTPIRVVIFEDRDRYEAFLRSYFPELPDRRAFFIQEGDHQRTVFAVRGERLRNDLRHELAHAILHSAGCKIPLWLDEGLAEYFESADQPGAVHASHVRKLIEERSAGWQPSGRRLESIRDLWQMKAGDYRESWLWVHYLLHQGEPNRPLLVGALKPIESETSSLHLYDRMLAHSTDPDRDVANHLDQLAQSLSTLAPTASEAFPERSKSSPKEEQGVSARGPGLESARQKLGLPPSGTGGGVKSGKGQVEKSQSFVPGFEGTSLLEVLGDHLGAGPQAIQNPTEILPGGEPNQEFLEPIGAAGPP
jgi:hypothetical protein